MPKQVLAALHPNEVSLAKLWWSQLENDMRQALFVLWQRRMDSWRRLELQVVAEFTEEKQFDARVWPAALSDYLAGHEAYLRDFGRTIPICTHTIQARRAIQNGGFPAHFDCQCTLPECVMRRALQLAPGQHLHLNVTCRLLLPDGTPIAEL